MHGGEARSLPYPLWLYTFYQLLTMGYIYLIRNLVNGKGYVGQTTNLLKRWIQHKGKPWTEARRSAQIKRKSL